MSIVREGIVLWAAAS